MKNISFVRFLFPAHNTELKTVAQPHLNLSVLSCFQIPFTKDCGLDELCSNDLELSVMTESKGPR